MGISTARLIILSSLFAGALSAQQPQLGCAGPRRTVSMDGVTFSVDSLSDWKYDCEPSTAEGWALSATRRPRNLNSFFATLYATVSPIRADSTVSLEDRIGRDLALKRSVAPDLMVESRGRLRTRSGEEAHIRQIATRGRYHLIAYIPSGDKLVMIGARSYALDVLSQTRSHFEQLVKSYSSSGAP
jgi:hypothetical protein